jgi:hypothetical protein
MKITELVMESRKIDEAPMGMLNKLGNKVMSKFGSDASTGKLKSGEVANKLYSSFNQYLGQSGQEPTWPVVKNWLQSNKYPTSRAEKIVKAAGAASRIPKGPGMLQRTGAKIKQGYDAAKQGVGNAVTNVSNRMDQAASDAAGGLPGMREGSINEANSPPLDKKTLEKVFLTAAQEAAQVVQQKKQNNMGGGQQGNNGQQGRNGLTVQQGGKGQSQGGDPQLQQAVSDLSQRVDQLEKQSGGQVQQPKRNRGRNTNANP